MGKAKVKEKVKTSKYFILERLINEREGIKEKLQTIGTSKEREKFLVKEFGHEIGTKILEEKYPSHFHDFKMKHNWKYRYFTNIKIYVQNNYKKIGSVFLFLILVFVFILFVKSCNQQPPKSNIARVIAVDPTDNKVSLYEDKKGSFEKSEDFVKYGETVQIIRPINADFTEIKIKKWYFFSDKRLIKTMHIIQECNFCLLQSFAGESFGPDSYDLLNTDSWNQKALIEYYKEKGMIGPFSSKTLSNCIRHNKIKSNATSIKWMVDKDFRTEHKKAASLKWGSFFNKGEAFKYKGEKANNTAIILKSLQTDYRLLLILETKNKENGDPITDVVKEYILPDSLFAGYYIKREKDVEGISAGEHLLTLFNPFVQDDNIQYGYSSMYNCMAQPGLLKAIKKDDISKTDSYSRRNNYPQLEDLNKWVLIERKIHLLNHQSSKPGSKKVDRQSIISNEKNVSFYDNKNNLYLGNHKDMLKNGNGVMCFNDGYIYDGSWKNNLRHGNGHSYHINQSINYIGGWRNDLKDGRGVYTDNNNHIQKGYFRKGEFQGK